MADTGMLVYSIERIVTAVSNVENIIRDNLAIVSPLYFVYLINADYSEKVYIDVSLTLMGNRSFLGHKEKSDLLLSVFHFAEEFWSRPSLSNLTGIIAPHYQFILQYELTLRSVISNWEKVKYPANSKSCDNHYAQCFEQTPETHLPQHDGKWGDTWEKHNQYDAADYELFGR